MFSLQNKSAIITGAGSGIGRAIAECFVTAGATVHGVDLNTSTFPTGVLPHACDVTSATAVANLAAQVLSTSGRIDILVNAAGIAHVGKLESTPEADFDRVYAVNVKGIFLMMQAVIAAMKTQHHGVILNVGSIAATVGIPDRFAYSTSKGAVLSMTLSVAKDYIAEGIRCNSISPARVHTPFVDGFIAKNYPGKEKEMFEKLSRTQPIGRMAAPSEVAALALYLCSDEAGFITGCDYPIDGGFIKLNN